MRLLYLVVCLSMSASVARSLAFPDQGAELTVHSWFGIQTAPLKLDPLPKGPVLILADTLQVDNFVHVGRPLYVIARSIKINERLWVARGESLVIVAESLSFGPKGCILFDGPGRKGRGPGSCTIVFDQWSVEGLEDEIRKERAESRYRNYVFSRYRALGVDSRVAFDARGKSTLPPECLQGLLGGGVEPALVEHEPASRFGVALRGCVVYHSVACVGGLAVERSLDAASRYVPEGAFENWTCRYLDSMQSMIEHQRLRGASRQELATLIEKARDLPFLPRGGGGNTQKALKRKSEFLAYLDRLNAVESMKVGYFERSNARAECVVSWGRGLAAVLPNAALVMPLEAGGHSWLGMLGELDEKRRVALRLEFELHVDAFIPRMAERQSNLPTMVLGVHASTRVTYRASCHSLLAESVDVGFVGNRMAVQLLVSESALGGVLTQLSSPSGIPVRIEYEIDSPFSHAGEFVIPMTLCRQRGPETSVRFTKNGSGDVLAHNENPFPIRIEYLINNDEVILVDQPIEVSGKATARLPARTAVEIGEPEGLHVTAGGVLCLGMTARDLRSPTRPVRVITVRSSFGFDPDLGGSLRQLKVQLVQLDASTGEILSRSEFYRFPHREVSTIVQIPVYGVDSNSRFYLEGEVNYESGRHRIRTEPKQGDYLTILPSDLIGS